MDTDHALTPQEVADILKIAKNTVYELIKRGELTSYRVGNKVRVDLHDVEEYKKRFKTPKNIHSEFEYNHQLPIKKDPAANVENSPEQGFIICGQDVILDILSRYFEQQVNGARALRLYIGSYNSLYALYQGKVHIATAHIWDGDSGQYNLPFVRRMLPGIPTVIIHLAVRMQGFYIAKGNPKNIHGWEDLKRSDLSLINREKGSGTRILLDERLRKMGIPAKMVKGYAQEYNSHLAVASAVARGEADLGLGNEKSALQVKEIDFLPMQKEHYDLIIKKEDLSNPLFQTIIEIVRSPAFQAEISGLGGYDLTNSGKIVGET